MKPEPTPRIGACFGTGNRKCLKNPNSGSFSSNGSSSPAAALTGLVTLMLTTAGPACSASSLKSGALNPAPAEACATTASAGAFAVGDAVDGEQPATNAGRNAAMTAARINFTFIGIPSCRINRAIASPTPEARCRTLLLQHTDPVEGTE